MWGHRHIMQALATISEQVHNCERMLIMLLTNSRKDFSKEDALVLKATDKVNLELKHLQAATPSQASNPNQKDK